MLGPLVRRRPSRAGPEPGRTRVVGPTSGTLSPMDAEQTDVADETTQDDQEIADELLIEEISIDGMCGVY